MMIEWWLATIGWLSLSHHFRHWYGSCYALRCP